MQYACPLSADDYQHGILFDDYVQFVPVDAERPCEFAREDANRCAWRKGWKGVDLEEKFGKTQEKIIGDITAWGAPVERIIQTSLLTLDAIFLPAFRASSLRKLSGLGLPRSG